MPYGELQLIPGVNVERTPTLLKAGVSSSQLIRYKDGLIQKYGGCVGTTFLTNAGTIIETHAWATLSGVNYVGLFGDTGFAALGPQLQTVGGPILARNVFTAISTTGGMQTIANSTAVTFTATWPVGGNWRAATGDLIVFDTPVSIGSTIISGAYQAVGTGANVLFYLPSPALASATTAAVPIFQTFSSAVNVHVNFPNHGLSVGSSIDFPIPTTANGITIVGVYEVPEIIDANNIGIFSVVPASSAGTFAMNNNAISVAGYGSSVPLVQQPATSTVYTSDNWGELLLGCPRPGPILVVNIESSTYSVVSTGPAYNNGIFVSTAQQQLVAWGSTSNATIGQYPDPLLIRWSDVSDYTQWTPLTTNQAGDFRIPTGSAIRTALSAPSQNLIWTDIELWAMNYIGYPLVWGFNKIGGNCGAISTHCAAMFRGSVYWMGFGNFYSYSSGVVTPIPCPVWDFVFQNINTSFYENIRVATNSQFNEVGWFFPSVTSTTGVNDSFVKFNVAETGTPWDVSAGSSKFFAMPRSTWIDVSVFGSPIATVGSIVFQQETGNDIASDGVANALLASFTTGYFFIDEGEEYVFVDQFIPDFKWGTYGASPSATVQLTFNVINYPGDTPTSYGPFSVTSTTQYNTVRFRGRQVSVTVASSDVGSFWRLGRVRFRYQLDGRR